TVESLFESSIRHDHATDALLDPKLAQAERDGTNPLRHLAVRDGRPNTVLLMAERSGMARVLLDRREEQPRQRASGGAVHGRNRTTNVTGEPATRVPTARRALA